MSAPPLSNAIETFDQCTTLPANTARSGIRTIPFWRSAFAAAGPGYLIAVGYMDPGNWATDIAGGSRFGFALLPVIVVSSIAAMFLQWLSLRLGIASGKNLAQHCGAEYPPSVAKFLWITCEIAIIACDLAEVIGTAIALELLFQLPLILGVLLTTADTLIFLSFKRIGARTIEAIVIALVAVIAACFAYELAMSHPQVRAIAGAFAPQSFPHGTVAVYLALGIFGATVMPHNLYLHSAIAQSRVPARTFNEKRASIRFSTVDCLTALTLALLINAAILITAACAFHVPGVGGVESLEKAYKLLSPALGAGAASVVFAVALLAAGQNSTLTGVMAGQIVVEGFLNLKISGCSRRLLTRGAAIIPALFVIWIAGENGMSKLLIFSQVVLSAQLGFAVVPLVRFTSDTGVMGPFVNGQVTRVCGYALAGAIILVNAWLVIISI